MKINAKFFRIVFILIFVAIAGFASFNFSDYAEAPDQSNSQNNLSNLSISSKLNTQGYFKTNNIFNLLKIQTGYPTPRGCYGNSLSLEEQITMCECSHANLTLDSNNVESYVEIDGWPLQFAYYNVTPCGNLNEYLIVPLLINLAIFAAIFYLISIPLIKLYKPVIHSTKVSHHK
jgi:hypothetical protein